MQKSPFPILLPQAEPDPWPGYTLTSSFRPLIFCKESNNIPARSEELKSDLTAKSGLPTSFRNKVSPVNTHCYLLLESTSSRQLLYSVCPGVCIVLNLTFPTFSSSPSLRTLIPCVGNPLGPM